MSKVGRYSVRIYDISCESLCAKDSGGTSDPFCKFDFDKFKKFNTPVVKKTLNPKYDTDEKFFYTTQYADRLHHKNLVIDCHDKDFWGSKYIGTAKVDLHTILTGPIYHNLPLQDRGKNSGRVKFKVEMTQLFNLKIYFQGATITDLPRIKGSDPNIRLRFYTDVNDHNLNVTSDEQRRTCNPEWRSLETLRINSDFRQIMSTTLYAEVQNNGERIGMVKIPFRKYYEVTDGRDVTVSEPVVLDSKVSGSNPQFKATLYYKNFPNTSHMIGGEHNDHGIIDARFFHPAAEKPKKVKVFGVGETKQQPRRPPQRQPQPAPAVRRQPVPVVAPRPAIVQGSVSTVSASAGATVVSASSVRPAAPRAGSAIIGSVVRPAAPTAPARVNSTPAPVVSGAVLRPAGGGAGAAAGFPNYLARLSPADRQRTLAMRLPAPWTAHVNAQGRLYFSNHTTRKTQWTHPFQQQQAAPALISAPRPAAMAPRSMYMGGPVSVGGASMRPAAQVGGSQKFPPVNAQAVQTLVAMGFDSKLATEALVINPSVQRATAWLSTEPVPLSNAWEVRKDPRNGRIFYANSEYKYTQWSRPILPQAYDTSYKTLLGMGFPRRVCVEALVHYKGNLRAATNWILYNKPQPLPAQFVMLVENNQLLYFDKTTRKKSQQRPVRPIF